MKSSKYYILLFVLFCNVLQAQKNSYFFGKKNVVSLGLSLPLSEYAFKKNINRIPFNPQLKIERIIHRKKMIEANLYFNKLSFNDKFKNDGFPSSYFISYNDMKRKVNNGSGKIHANQFGLITSLKLFSKYSSYAPVGRYFSLSGGFSLNNISVKKGYEFSYTEELNNVKTSYIVSRNSRYYFPRYLLGMQFGKTNRFLKDNLLLTYSLSFNYHFKNRLYEREELRQRFIFVAQNQIQKNLLILANINIGHVF